MALITASDIQARMTTEAYDRVWDKDGTGSVDSSFQAVCIASATSEARMRCGAAFPEDWETNGATPDVAIVDHVCALAIYKGVRLNPSAGGQVSPYEKAYKEALDFFDRLSRDDRNRLRTSYGGRARPRADIENLTRAGDGVETNAYVRSADQKDPSGF